MRALPTQWESTRAGGQGTTVLASVIAKTHAQAPKSPTPSFWEQVPLGCTFGTGVATGGQLQAHTPRHRDDSWHGYMLEREAVGQRAGGAGCGVLAACSISAVRSRAMHPSHLCACAARPSAAYGSIFGPFIWSHLHVLLHKPGESPWPHSMHRGRLPGSLTAQGSPPSD